MKYRAIGYKWEYEGGMSPNDFERYNTDILQEIWIKNNEDKILVKDDIPDLYEQNIDWKFIYEIMIVCYKKWLDGF